MENDRKSGSFNTENRIELFTIIHDIAVNWWVILLCSQSAAMLTFVLVSVRYVPNYTVSATFAVSSKSGSYNYNQLNSAKSMAVTFQQVLKSNVVKKKAMEALQIDDDNVKIDTQVIDETNLLTLSVTSLSPKTSFDFINALIENYESVSLYTVEDGILNVIKEPQIPFYPDNPIGAASAGIKVFILFAVLLIFIFGLISWLNDTIKNEHDIDQKLDAENLGIISYEFKHKTLKDMIKRKNKALLVINDTIKNEHDIDQKLDAENLGIISYEFKHKTLKDMIKRKNKALLVNSPLSGFKFVEENRKLAAKVDYYMYRDDMKVLSVTSVAENEGKSTVAANLAVSLAEQSKKVLLIDGDLRHPSQFLIFGMHPKDKNEFGEFLKGKAEIDNVLLRSGVPNLYLMLGRNCYSSSTDILHGERLKTIIESSRQSFDYIIIDSSPAGVIGDAEILAGYSDAVMIVAKQNYIKAEDINDVIDMLSSGNTKILGVVLNGVQTISSVADFSMVRYGDYGKYSK